MEVRFFPFYWDIDAHTYLKEYVDMLREDGKSIRIRKIVQQIGTYNAHIYYDILPKTTIPVKETDRFNDLDM